jgi:hypothetical protein
MAVKDLISLYDPLPSNVAEANTRRLSRTEAYPLSNLNASAQPSHFDGPPPTPARFIKHYNQRNQPPSVRDKNSASPVATPSLLTTSDTPFHDTANDNTDSSQITLDVTEEAHVYLKKSTPTSSSSSAAEQHLLVSDGREIRQDSEEHQYLLSKDLHRYPPDARSASRLLHKASLASTSTAVHQYRNRSTHTPVPAVTLFARKAAPLYLPKLDDYLSSLEAPKFALLEGKGKGRAPEPLMFPPMDRLAASGRTIEELEENSLLPSWGNRGTILGAIASMILGLTVGLVSSVAAGRIH